MQTIELKCWPKSFGSVLSGSKTFEIRKEDRHTFQRGDRLKLREWDPETGKYTGAFQLVNVTHVERGPDWGLPIGLAVMSIK